MKTSKTIYILVGVLLFSVLFLTNCNQDFEEMSDDASIEKRENLGKPLIDMSFDIETFKDFETTSLKLSSLDLASINPSNEKQHIQIQLLENGQMNLIIEELDFKRKINIKHQILADDTPKTVKTEIIGNVAKFYDKSGKLINKESVEISNQLETVERLKKLGDKFSDQDMNKIIASIQGQQFIDDLDTLLKNASENGVKILEQGKNYITLRMPKEKMGADIEIETVLLVNKTINKIVGSRIYDAQNELLQSTFFGYSNGEMQFLNAMKQVEKISLPSGKKMNMLTNTKIDNFKFNLNI